MEGDLNSGLVTPIQRKLKINIPEALQDWLVDDWDLITRQHKLALLPAKLTVAQIADNYLKHMQCTEPTESITVYTVIDCIINYFNKMLGPQLLYKFEKPQYSKTIEDYPGTPMSEMYGSIHLLRLFTRMKPMLAHALEELGEEGLKEVTNHIEEFLMYLITLRGGLFSLLDYGNAPPAYLEKYGNEPLVPYKDLFARKDLFDKESDEESDDESE